MSRDAFVSCYRQHVDFVWRLARALGVEATHVDDIVHEVFMVVQRKLSQREPHERLRPWLAGITRNLVLHHRRSRADSSARSALEELPHALDHGGPPQPCIELP